MSRKRSTPAPNPTYPFLVLNADCNNVEGSFRTLDAAVAAANDDHDKNMLDEYIYIVEVVAVHRIETEPHAVPATLSDLAAF
jgi:hypothetical protein